MLVHMVKIPLALALALALVVGCGPAVTVPSAAPSATPTRSAPSPTPTATPTRTAAPLPSPSPSGSPIPLPTNAQLAAAGNGVVWMLVAVTHLFRSTDRGETWTERAPPPLSANVEIAFVSDTDGWAAQIGSPATQCQSQSVAIWHTTDGALTWQRLDGSGIADAQCKTGLAFVDAQHGFLSAYDPNSAPVIYRTADGGKTWAASSRLPDPPGFTTAPGGFTLRPGPVADFGSALFVYAVGQSNGTEKTYVFRSSDGAASWTYASTAPDDHEAVTFVTPARWLQIAPPQPEETTDNGASWHAFATDYMQAAPISPQIVFADADTGYATVRGDLTRTTDGGAHWTALKTPGT